jgi:hypothetical protein
LRIRLDCDAVAEVLGTARDHSHEGEDAEDIERREYGEGEDIEGGADLRCLADEPQRDQGAGDREDVERGAGGALARGLRAGALEREVLGGQSRQELLAIRGLRHLTNVQRRLDASLVPFRVLEPLEWPLLDQPAADCGV